MLIKYRILGAVAALLLMGTAVVASTAAGGAATTKGDSVSDTITFSGQAIIAVAPTETKPGSGSLVARECSLKSEEANPFSCTVAGTARLTLTGGTLTGAIRSADSFITFNETFVSTSTTSGTGQGTCTEFDYDTRSSSDCTFTASFTTSATSVGNIVNDSGTITVFDNATTTTTAATTTTTAATTTTTAATTTTTAGSTTTVGTAG